MAELQEIFHNLQQLAVPFLSLFIWLTAFFDTCFVPFLHSLSEVLSALRQVSIEGRKLVQERQEWRRVLKTPSSSLKTRR
jgi:hypothetical protein